MKSRKTILSLPGEIVNNILSRLSAKCLGRCKCVCKPLNFQISDKKFHKLHLNRSILDTTQSRILTLSPFYSLNFESIYSYEDVEDDDKNKGLVELKFSLIQQKPDFDPDVSGSVEFVGSCNGILCLCIDMNSFILWNPTIGESREIPDPTSSDFLFFGFGYDMSNDDYKLVTCVSEKNSKLVRVFSFKVGSWVRIEHELGDIRIDDSPSVGTYLNGVLHWEVTRENAPNIRKALISLNLVGEKYEFGEIPKPSFSNEDVSIHDLSVIGGCLSLLSDERYIKLGIWVMKEYNVRESWTRIALLDLSDFSWMCYVKPLCIAKNGDLIIDIDGDILVRYNMNEKSSRPLKNECDPYLSYPLYVESLISPNGF